MVHIHHLRTRMIYEFYLGLQIMSIVIILIALNIFNLFHGPAIFQIEVFIFLYGLYILYKLLSYIRKAYFQNEEGTAYTNLLISLLDIFFLTAFLHITKNYFHVLSHLLYFYIIFQSILFHHMSYSIFSTLTALSYMLLVLLGDLEDLVAVEVIIHMALFYLSGYVLSTVINEINRLEYNITFMNNELEQKNRQLSEMANKDFLTNMYNHKCFYFHFSELIKESKISAVPFSLALLDIDNFKKINDTYGHLAGDMILKEISLLILTNIRKTDIAARYGGEEFAIIFPDTSLEEAKVICERIRIAIEKHRFYVHDQLLQATVSGGLRNTSCCGPACRQDIFLNSVDQLLYQAKATGKNQICAA